MLPDNFDVEVSTSGDSPVTVTVSARFDGDICRLIEAVCPTRTSTPLCETGVEPGKCDGHICSWIGSVCPPRTSTPLCETVVNPGNCAVILYNPTRTAI